MIIWGLVVICFLFFILWLLAMATCPDRLVYLLSEATPLRTYAKSPQQAGESSPLSANRDPWVIDEETVNGGGGGGGEGRTSLPQAPLSGILIHRSQEISDLTSMEAIQGSASIASATYVASLPTVEEEPSQPKVSTSGPS